MMTSNQFKYYSKKDGNLYFNYYKPKYRLTKNIDMKSNFADSLSQRNPFSFQEKNRFPAFYIPGTFFNYYSNLILF